MKLSEKIYTCRKKAGLSQEALAEKLGVSRQAVSKWETEEAIPELSKIPMMAKIFNVTTDWLLFDNENFEEKPIEEISPEIPVTITLKSPSSTSIKKNSWIIGIYLSFIGTLLSLIALCEVGAAYNALAEAKTPLSFMITPEGEIPIINSQKVEAANTALDFAYGFLVIGLIVLVVGIFVAIFLKKKYHTNFINEGDSL